jgi:hypothetical protein
MYGMPASMPEGSSPGIYNQGEMDFSSPYDFECALSREASSTRSLMIPASLTANSLINFPSYWFVARRPINQLFTFFVEEDAG